MRGFTVLSAAAVAALMTSAAFGADLMMTPPAPAEAMTDGFAWDGLYGGISVGYDTTGDAELKGVVGVNLLPAESFLIGIEGGLGYYFDVGNGGGNGVYTTVGARAGFISGPALYYLTAGAWYDVTYGGPVYGFVGGGVEFAVGDNTSIQLQAVYYPSYGDSDVTASLLWHMH
ncbi:MAG: hypothetical protein ABI697_06815 [Devosia sp.]